MPNALVAASATALSSSTRRRVLNGIAAALLAAPSAMAIVTAGSAEPFDPLLDVLEGYHTQLKAFNDLSTNGMTDEQLNELRQATWWPLWWGVSEKKIELPPATTDAGAAMALRCILMEDNLHSFDETPLRAALAYFGGRAA